MATTESSELSLPTLRIAEEPGEQLSGGTTTVFDTSVNAFGNTPSNLTNPRWLKFIKGKFLFNRNFKIEEGKSSPLGPRFSAVSCKGCHLKDGRGRPPEKMGEIPKSMVVRLAALRDGGTSVDPAYGEQLDFHAMPGTVPEGMISIRYEEIFGEFGDGSEYVLQKPIYSITNLGYGDLSEVTRSSPRVSPVTFGMGLLQAIPEQRILALADPDDADGDGVSGRPNYVDDRVSGMIRLGRFGWKASQPTVLQQIASAFIADMGISSVLFSEQKIARDVTVQPYELSDERLDRITYYMTLVAPPARRNWNNSTVLRGKAIFNHIGCGSCHTPVHKTAILDGFPEVSNQTIRPYSDLLLHDMGEDLADDLPEGRANGREWRTPPLWGLGLIEKVNKHSRFLHDGRARNIEEAILWHGGESSRSQSAYRRLRAADRQSLLEFLKSL